MDNLGGRKFTEDDINACWPYSASYLVDILNGDYDIDTAREDLNSLIGSKYDARIAIGKP